MAKWDSRDNWAIVAAASLSALAILGVFAGVIGLIGLTSDRDLKSTSDWIGILSLISVIVMIIASAKVDSREGL